MHEIASLVTCNFKILGGAYPRYLGYQRVSSVCSTRTSFVKTRAASQREKTFLRAGHFEDAKAETAREKPLAPRVTSGPLTLDFPLRANRASIYTPCYALFDECENFC